MNVVVTGTPEVFDAQLDVVAHYAAAAMTGPAPADDKIALEQIAVEVSDEYALSCLRICLSAEPDKLAAFARVEPYFASIEMDLRSAEQVGERREEHLLHLWTKLRDQREAIRQAWLATEAR